MEKLLNAITLDLDAITFWANEENITPASATVSTKEKECRWCNTEYNTRYCPTCGMDND